MPKLELSVLMSSLIVTHSATTATAQTTPELMPGDMAYAGGSVLLLVLILFLLVRKRFPRGGAFGKNSDDAAVQALAAMCFIATANDAKDAPVKLMSDTLERLTATKYKPAQIREMLQYTAKNRDTVMALGTDLTEQERLLVMEAAMRVAVAEGRIDGPEYDAMTRIALKLEVSGQSMRDILAGIVVRQNAAA